MTAGVVSDRRRELAGQHRDPRGRTGAHRDHRTPEHVPGRERVADLSRGQCERDIDLAAAADGAR